MSEQYTNPEEHPSVKLLREIFPPEEYAQIDEPENPNEQLWEKLKARRYDPYLKLPPAEFIHSIGGVGVCTRGNLTQIASQAKAGKTALCGALIAASILGDSEECDLLGVTAKKNTDRRAVIYVDTEQSKEDFQMIMDRVAVRAKLDITPDWFCPYRLTGLTTQECVNSMRLLLTQHSKEHGGCHSLVLDGIGDLVTDVNNAEECNALVTQLMAMSDEFDIPIIVILHLNPTSGQSVAKTRGHLGSQLDRKSETTIQLEKDDEETLVYTTKTRKAPLIKKDGVRFAWNEDAKMHTLCAKDPKKTGSRLDELMIDLVNHIFKGVRTIRWKDLIDEIMRETGRTAKTAENHIKRMLDMQLIVKNGLEYHKK